MSSTNASRPTSFAWGGNRWSGVSPSTWRWEAWPDPTSAALPGGPAPDEEDEAAHDEGDDE
ncbi:MAG TPA: hypothetical protein VFL46_13030, partial [Phycicoccus sp.]|nr:hypothetical protein [Phycicoccus sp.]